AEGAPEDADFVVALHVGTDAVVAGGHRLRDAGELLDRTRDSFRDEPGKEEREEQRRAAADEERLFDFLEGCELAIERAEEDRGADDVVAGQERLAGEDVAALVDGDGAGLHSAHLLHAGARRIRRTNRAAV